MGLFSNLLQTRSTRSVSPKEAYEALKKDASIKLIDVRADYEYKEGHIKNAVNLPLPSLSTLAPKHLPDKNQVIYVYCLSGGRSSRACDLLSQMGYENIYNLGGISNWPYEIIK